MVNDDIAYFRKRLSEERAREAKEGLDEVRRVHHARAQLYAERLAALDAAGTVLVPLRAQG